MAKLTDEQKKNLYREWLTGNYSLMQLANRYGISQSSVSNLIGKILTKQKDGI